jgi:circadian clock protein KaiC
MFAAANPAGAVYCTFDEAPELLQSYLSAWDTPDTIHFVDFRADDSLVSSSPGGVEVGGLLVRIRHAAEKTGARVVVLDAFDFIANNFGNTQAVRQGMAAVFNWARESGVTLLVTSGVDADYRSATGLIDYLADCVLELGQSIDDMLMTRTLRVVKLRGGRHGTNVYPFMIDEHGLSVLPVTDTALTTAALEERCSTGIDTLDAALGGHGIWAGSTTLLSGCSGTGKSIVAARVARALCDAGKRTLYLSYEESPQQLRRDVASAGVQLDTAIEDGRLLLYARRAVEQGIEEHLTWLFHEVRRQSVDAVIIDPISALYDVATPRVFKNLVLRVAHQLKSDGITLFLVDLVPETADGSSSLNVSSLVDTWLRLERRREGRELRRSLFVHKSRGTATSRAIMDFEITDRGLAFATPAGLA